MKISEAQRKVLAPYAEQAEAAVLALREALRWAMPLAKIALEDHRQMRLRAGHKVGTKQLGLHDSEVDEMERADQAVADHALLARDIEARIRADERERCAKAAENCPVVVTDACFEYGKIQIDEARKSIAAAIRGATDADRHHHNPGRDAQSDADRT